ncbi:hypothetical protein [Lignipirellula cremea]|uniref:Uncharacterized protein n=1 Tax=Lignipirellula cremea TaxID=2528010 RepID=A0A518DTJ9_9BACT|nr:hypothetical protein [Lignipirellula cremea]QDU95167.1 hypothetical protein Pla8534_29790 [Lignipirellula cremea]
MTEPFLLTRQPAEKPVPMRFETVPARQAKLFSGMDCLPGQQELPGMEDIDAPLEKED